ncbi:TonB-dependent receptor [Sphingomonas oryzagri]
MKVRYSFCMILLAGCAPAALAAQVNPNPGPAEQGAALQNSGPAEIVVTANKRQENINKVGLSITAISAAQLANRKITSLDDVAAAVPGLTFAPSGNNTPIFTLRGIGFNESSIGVYPAVSVYVDQAPLPFPVMESHSAFDLERIEVLKGPQGTLFGENSTGGAINYIAAKPTKTFTAGGDISYGRFNQLDGNVYISGPITDTLGFRVSATGHHMDDWQYSITRNDTNGHQSYAAGRLILDWKPTDAVRFSLNVNGWVDKSQPQALQMIAIRPQNPAFEQEAFPQPDFSPNKARAANWTNTFLDPALGLEDPATGAPVAGTAQPNDVAPFGDRKFLQVALRTDVDLSDDITLTSLTSYDGYKQRESIDSDGTQYVIVALPHVDGHIHSFNQELRVANAATNRFRWILGGNYEHSNTFEYQQNRYLHTAYYNPADLYINDSSVDNNQKIRNYAFFGNAEFSVTHNIVLKGGVRYTDSRNKADICSFTIPGGNVDKLFNILGAELGSVPFTPIGTGPGNCYSLNENLVPGQPFIKTLHQTNVSWRAGIDYQVTPTTLFYVNVSRGYKAGSFPSLAASSYAGLEPVTQESVTAYEGGVKSQLFDRRVDLTAAAFYYDYRNKQVRGKLADPIFGNLDALVNIPKSRVYGAEANATFRASEGLTLSANGTYLNSKILKYSGVNILGEPNFNSAGDPLPFTPKWSGSFDADYRARTDKGTPFFGFTVNMRSSSEAAISAARLDYAAGTNAIVRPGVNCVFCIKGYTTVDARAGFEADGGRWKIMFWGKNIFNKYYWTNVVPGYDDAARLAGLPATYGVTLGFKFN